ncbi:MAG: hypothetical protein H6713_39505 [Myxococcales bacterium]|nr:hypothetical protein [Myxococcales bacterium]MCB9756048.1 hypothetical protein [Myxococcales bacterium]
MGDPDIVAPDASTGSSTSDGHPDRAAGDAPAGEREYYGTFTGVFTPTILTIFGVIMYVRVGWTVGNAGLLGAWIVMLLAMGIAAATGLSLASIATNTRLGPGGPYAVLARSLGYEVGGAIGVPLYLTRPLGVAMYIIGFREGWIWIFPDHPAIVVDLTLFAALSIISLIGPNLAFRLQYVIMAVVFASLVSIFASPVTLAPVADTLWWGRYPGFLEDGFRGTDFWGVFAVFFPASTGILAGANMSGDLRDPRRSIPSGTLWAIGISAVVYFALAWWVARAGTPGELTSNYSLAIERARWPALVLAGLLGATVSSALAGLVDGPRILMAMAQNGIIPYGERLAKVSRSGNPRAAIVFTSLVTFACIMVRDLNTIAPIVTMFFLITYCMLNVVLLVEAGVSLMSFRPTLRIPQAVPLLGALGSVFAMFIVNPTFGLLSIVLVLGFYAWIQWRGHHEPVEDVRSSVYVSLAQWAATRVTEAQHENVRAWKPNMLVPVDDPERVRGEYHLLLDLTKPDGSLTLLGLAPGMGAGRLRARLLGLSNRFRRDGIQSTATVVRAEDATEGLCVAVDALQAAFFRPNLLVVPLEGGDERLEALDVVVNHMLVSRVGVLLIAEHPRAGFGQRETIHVWIKPPDRRWDVEDALSCGNVNLNLLTGYRLMRQWQATLRLITVVERDADAPAAEAFLRELSDRVRFPESIERAVLVGDFWHALGGGDIADVNLIGLATQPDLKRLFIFVQATHATCIFARDSGRESALV